MEYSLKDLDKAILYYLSINKDTPKSITQIYNGLIDEAIVPNLNDINNHDNNIVKIKTVCYSINNKYEPIHKIFPNDRLHLLYSNSNTDEIINDYIQKYNNSNNNNENDPIENKNIDYDRVVKDIALNPTEYPFLNVNDKIDGKNTPYHYCCKFKEEKYLKYLFKYYKIDTDMVNEEGKTGIELALDINLSKNVDLIHNYSNMIVTNQLKENNSKLQSEYNLQLININQYKKSIAQKTNYIITLWCLMLSLFILFDEIPFSLYYPFINQNIVYSVISLIILQLFLDQNIVFLINFLHIFIMLSLISYCYYSEIIQSINLIGIKNYINEL